MTSVLLAEDDVSISDPLARALRREGYEVEVKSEGTAVLQRVLSGGVDLVVLDLGRLIANGPPKEVLGDARVMASYLGEAADA